MHKLQEAASMMADILRHIEPEYIDCIHRHSIDTTGAITLEWDFLGYSTTNGLLIFDGWKISLTILADSYNVSYLVANNQEGSTLNTINEKYILKQGAAKTINNFLKEHLYKNQY